MTFFDWNSPADSPNGTVSRWIWVYVVMTVTFTMFTLATWYYLVFFRGRRRAARADEEMGSMNSDLGE